MKLKKLFLFWLLFSLPFFLIACGTEKNATSPLPAANGQKINENVYLYYYGQTCQHCKNVEDYLKKSWVDQRITIIPKEITLQANAANREECLNIATELGIPISQVGTPFVVVTEPDGKRYGLIGEDEVLDHFKALEKEIRGEKNEDTTSPYTPYLIVDDTNI